MPRGANGKFNVALSGFTGHLLDTGLAKVP